MKSNEAIKFLGQFILNEYNENIGIVLGYVCNGIGDVLSFIVSLAGEIHEIPIDRFEIFDTRIVYLSPISYDFKNLIEKLKAANLRISLLNKLNSDNDINREAWERFKLKVEVSYKEIINNFNELKNRVDSRIQELKNKEKALDEALIELKLSYIENVISKENYENSLRIILNAKQRISNELNHLRNIQNNILNSEVMDMIEVKVIQ
ncbi:MAG: CdvA-like protein [Thermoproteota archaeon]|jgi:chaperonin cofactor prefoldin|nr:CdvA-like protein [Thermoproteota archaeon]